MSDIWYISARLDHQLGHKRVNYKMDDAQEYAEPPLGAILLWLIDPLKMLAKDLEKKKADAKDIQYVKWEIEFVEEMKKKWETECKKW